MRAVPVTDKATLKAFHQVPRIIYAGDENYIAHVIQDIDKVFDPKKNKLFKEGGVSERWVFYNDQGDLVGRIAAFVNPKTAHVEDQPTGGMGFFESIDDQATANFILDTAKSWLEGQGMEAMDGPINFGERNQFWGCLTKNFTDPNSYAMNYNPPYYPTLLETYGFKTYFEQYLYKRDARVLPQPVFMRKHELFTSNPDITISDIEGKPLEQVAEDFRTVYNGAWGGYSDFKEMKPEAAQKIMQSLKPIIDRRIIVFAYYKGAPISFYVNIPELNEIFCYIDGNLNWWGKLVFLYHKWRKTPRTLVGIVFGVVKEWQKQGAEGAMIKFMSDQIHTGKVKYTQTVLQWIGDFNPKMLKVADNLGGERYREMKTYRYLFDQSKPFKRFPVVE